MHYDHVLKKLNIDLLTPRVRGVRAKCLLSCCYIVWLHLIWYATWHFSEKVEFWPFDPKGQGEEVQAKYLLLCYYISWLHLIWMQNDHFLKKLRWNSLQSHQGTGEGVCRQNIWYNVATFFILFNLIICNMTMFWKSPILTYWPLHQGWGGEGAGIGRLKANYLAPCCFIYDPLKFDLQLDTVLKKLNFDLLNPYPGFVGGGW